MEAKRRRPHRAARRFGAASALHDAVDPSGASLEPANAIAWRRQVANAQAQLDAPAWEAAWAGGGAMPIGAAVAYALDAAGDDGEPHPN